MPKYRIRCEILVDSENREKAASDAHNLMIEGLSSLEFDGKNGCLSVKITNTEEIK